MIESSYTKLFSSIISSSIWREDDKTRIVWITMLAMKNRHGQVSGSVPGIAAISNVSVDDCRKALVKLAAPDPDSRSMEFGGSRIEAIDGGWQILNHAKYRDAMSEDNRRAYKTEWQKKARERKQRAVDIPVDNLVSTWTHTDTDTDLGAEREYAPEVLETPSQETVLALAVKIGLAEWKALDWYREMQGCGWLDHHHRPIVAWSDVLSRVFTKWVADGKPTGPPVAQQLATTQTAAPRRPRGLSPLDLRTIIQAKQLEADSLKNKHSSEFAMGTTWSDKAAHISYIQLKAEIKKLNQQLASMA